MKFLKNIYETSYNCVLSTFFKVGKFFRLIDENNQMSITNIAVLVVIYKVGTAQEVDLYDAGLILIALLNYSYKRYMNVNESKKVNKETEEGQGLANQVKEDIKALKDKVGSLQVAVGLTRPTKR